MRKREAIFALIISCLFIGSVGIIIFHRQELKVEEGTLFWIETDLQTGASNLMACEFPDEEISIFASLDRQFEWDIIQENDGEIYLAKYSPEKELADIVLCLEGNLETINQIKTPQQPIHKVLAIYNNEVYISFIAGKNNGYNVFQIGRYNLEDKSIVMLGFELNTEEILHEPSISERGEIVYVRNKKLHLVNTEGEEKCLEETGRYPEWIEGEGKILYIHNDELFTMDSKTGEIDSLQSENKESIKVKTKNLPGMVFSKNKEYIIYSAMDTSSMIHLDNFGIELRLIERKTGRDKIIRREKGTKIKGDSIFWE